MYSYEEALEYIKRLFAKGSSISDPLKDVQVLAPMKKGLVGVNNINACLQAELNPRSEYKAEYQNGDTLFREGDKVMQVKNNYNIEWVIANNSRVSETGTGVFNGDMGTIMRIDHKINVSRCCLTMSAALHTASSSWKNLRLRTVFPSTRARAASSL